MLPRLGRYDHLRVGTQVFKSWFLWRWIHVCYCQHKHDQLDYNHDLYHLITNILISMIMILITTSSWSSKRLREEQLSERLCVRCHQPFSLLFNRYLFSSSLCWMFLGSSIWTNRFFAFFGYISTGILASTSSTSSGISVPLSSASPRRPYVDHCPNQATGLLTMWIGCLSVLLNSPLRLPALDLRPVQPTKVGAHILASREKMWILVFFWGERTNLFLPEASSSSYNLKWSILNKSHQWKKIIAEKLGFAWI